MKSEEDEGTEKVWIFLGISPDTSLIKVDKCVINIFFFGENIFFFFNLQETQAHLLVDGSVAMETRELDMKKMF